MPQMRSAHHARTLLLLKALHTHGRRVGCYGTMEIAGKAERRALDRWAADVFRFAG